MGRSFVVVWQQGVSEKSSFSSPCRREGGRGSGFWSKGNEGKGKDFHLIVDPPRSPLLTV